MIWDRGTWEPEGDPHKACARAIWRSASTARSCTAAGTWCACIAGPGEKRDNWLLIKQHDEAARTERDKDILEQMPLSVVSGRTMEEIAGARPHKRKARKRKTANDVKKQSKPKRPKRAAAHAANKQFMRKSPKPKRARNAAGKALARARRAALPAFVEPCLATLVDKAPDSGNWIHEIKFDGYRIQARLDHGKVKLLTRKGLDWTRKFPAVAEAVAELPAKTALIDGELVVEDAKGISRFSLLQQDLKQGRHDRMRLYAFDLMHLDGADLRPLPLIERKPALEKLCRAWARRAALQPFLDQAGTNPVQAGLQDGAGRHHLQARRRALPFRPRARLAQDQMLGPAGIRGAGLCAVERRRACGRRAGARRLSSAANCAMPGAPAPASRTKARASFIASSRRIGARPRRSTPCPRKSAGGARRSGSSRNSWSKSTSTAGPMAAGCARLRSRACARTSRPRTWCAR